MVAMSSHFHSIFYLFCACCLEVVLTVPPEFCFGQFNASDCKREPTPVFYYYRPGSRCEIQMWRGCPTENIFPNEYACAQNCIFRFRAPEPPTTTPEPIDCNAILNSTQCVNETVIVYTHVYGRCIEAEWGGCETDNKFNTKEDCDKVCETKPEVELEKKLQNLNESSLEQLNEILQKVLDEQEQASTEPTTEAETASPEHVSESEEHTVEEVDEEETTTEPAETTTNDDYYDTVIT